MRKKEANLYFPDKRYKDSPYLTKEQIKDFESQFTLFNRELNLAKLRETTINQNYHHSCKPVYNFIDEISQEKNVIDFCQYLNKMTSNLEGLNQGQLIADMLDDQKKGDITKQTLKQILQESLGREILPIQMNDIMLKLFEIRDQKVDKISTDHLKKVVNLKHQNIQ